MTRRQAGFTLVELLLAVTLMGLLLALAYGGLRAASKASESGQEMLSEASRLRITHQFVRKQFNLMLPLAFEDLEVDPPVRVSFEGERNRVLFVGPMPGYLARGGPQVQLFEFAEGESGLELQFSHAPLLGFERSQLLDLEPIVLFEDLAEGGFLFLDFDDEGQPIEWLERWEELGATPLSVRMEVRFADEARVAWPPLVASARLDPSSVIPGGGGGETYAERIQDMIQGRRNNQPREQARDPRRDGN
ncbi:MAG: prepilin-type N-terminal cleavage/methylation domain-containing protein [Pseudomonadota bacterium]